MKGLRLSLVDEAFLQALSRLDRQAVALNAADCAERVLPFFERCHPEDHRPRQAVEAARAWARGEISVGQARSAALAAHAAARESTDDAARAAARAAGNAAASAHVSRHALAVVSYAAMAAGHAAQDAEYRWQRAHLLAKRDAREMR